MLWKEEKKKPSTVYKPSFVSRSVCVGINIVYMLFHVVAPLHGHNERNITNERGNIDE